MSMKQEQPHPGKCIKLRLLWIEFDLISPVEDLSNILSKGSVSVVSRINYLCGQTFFLTK